MKRYLLITVFGLAGCTLAFSAEKKLKLYDSATQRAECPDGYDVGQRFVEMHGFDKNSRRAGVECILSNKPPPKKKTDKKNGVQRAPAEGPAQMEVLNEGDKKAKCPEGYTQTGTFSNIQIANGKMESRSGIYCSRGVGGDEAGGHNELDDVPSNRL